MLKLENKLEAAAAHQHHHRRTHHPGDVLVTRRAKREGHIRDQNTSAASTGYQVTASFPEVHIETLKEQKLQLSLHLGQKCLGSKSVK